LARLSLEDCHETASPVGGFGGLTPTTVSSFEDWSISTVLRLRCQGPTTRGAGVLGVGIDWAEEFHVVALGRPGEGVFEVARVDHDPRSVNALVARIATLEPDPAEVRVVLETSYGMLVERLLDAGYVVVPVNPDLVARRRGPAKKKDDAEDARIACLLALDRFERLRVLVPHGEPAAELRAITRDDERASRDERRLLNRMRADLMATFPAALAIAGDDLGSPTFLRLIERWPTANAWPQRRGASSRLSPVPPTTAGLTASPTASRPPWRPRSSSPATGSCEPRPTPSDSTPSSCSPWVRNAERGSGAWANCSWARPEPAALANPRTTSGGRRSLAVRST